MMQPNMMHSASHLLAEIEGLQQACIDEQKRQPQISVNCTELRKLLLESRWGVFFMKRLTPTGHVFQQLNVADDDLAKIRWYDLDIYDEQDWEFCKRRVSDSKSQSASSLRQLEKIKQATALCREALKFDHAGHQRQATIERALQICPKHCAMAHYLKFELYLFNNPGKFEPKFQSSKPVQRAIAILEDAVDAGKLAAELVDANEFCPGKFYTWMPTRWLVRATYTLGSFLAFMGRYNDANQVLKECLAMDAGDALGARHKQLLAVLQRDGIAGTGSKLEDKKFSEDGDDDDQVGWLLSARFGEDELKDTVYALFNYTRALRAFCVKGECRRSRALLKLAIERNPRVPKVLLAWEGSRAADEMMVLGSESEAADYCEDNSRFWRDTDGALDWLETVLCQVDKTCEPLTDNDEIRKLLVQTNDLLNDKTVATRAQAGQKIRRQALKNLERIEEMVKDTDSGSSKNSMKRIIYQRKGLCYVGLSVFEKALANFNSALCLCHPVRDKEELKELFYNRALCKEESGDLLGALEDYAFVYQRIGAFSTAYEGICRLEPQVRTAASVLPQRSSPFSDDVDVDGDVERVRRAMSVLLHTMPPIDLKANQPERCGHCQRGGISLAGCAGCKETKYCSKQCQVASWKAVHKYICVGSKHRIATGTKMTIQGLEKAPQHNGKQVVVKDFVAEKGRFVVEMEPDGNVTEKCKLSIRPQNLRRKT